MFYQCGQDKGCVCGRGDMEQTRQMWGHVIAHFCYQSWRLALIFLFHPLILFLIGSARRKLTCTICNRKCSSSLNLQEHRKVRLCNIYCSAHIIPNAYSASDLRGFAQLTQFCMIHFDKKEMSLFGCLWDPSHSSCYPAQPLNLSVVSASGASMFAVFGYSLST